MTGSGTLSLEVYVLRMAGVVTVLTMLGTVFVWGWWIALVPAGLGVLDVVDKYDYRTRSAWIRSVAWYSLFALAFAGIVLKIMATPAAGRGMTDGATWLVLAAAAGYFSRVAALITGKVRRVWSFTRISE